MRKLIKKINKEYLCLLKKDIKSKNIIIDYKKIKNSYSFKLINIESLCKKKSSTLKELSMYISKLKKFDIEGVQKYCNNLDGAYECISIDITETLDSIKQKEKEIVIYKNDQDRYKEELKNFKDNLLQTIKLWFASLNIEKAYKEMKKDNSVIVYSHRIPGWTFPEYKLHKNFSFQIKTNFGYGQSSFFYTKLKYKGVDIVPFSDWIRYEYAKLYEIIDYSSNHFVSNESWYESFSYIIDAYNLFLNNEKEFVQKYIINECENLISNLQRLIENDEITVWEGYSFFNSEKKSKILKLDNHKLIAFKGEKISGVLELLSIIKSFDSITPVNIFISEVESLNTMIFPILEDEMSNIELKLNKTNSLLDILMINYTDLENKNIKYNDSKKELKETITSQKFKNLFELNKEVNRLFLSTYPEYTNFYENYNEVKQKKFELENKKIYFKKIQKDIQLSIQRIKDYFRNE